MINSKIPLEPNKTYHIYNRAVGKEKLFKNAENYLFFLGKYNYYIEPIAETFAYCLMPNHIHFMIRIKDEESLLRAKQKFDLDNGKTNSHCVEWSTENQLKFTIRVFANLFSSYAQAYNKMYKRSGNLFISNFKRKLIDSTLYYNNLVKYIHQNPVNHKLVANLEDWYFSSYHTITSNKSSKIKKEDVLNWFGGKQNYLDFHCKKSFDLTFDF